MIDAENSDIELNDEQRKAVKSLERAFAKCLKAKIHFHNHYGMLMAYLSTSENPVHTASGKANRIPWSNPPMPENALKYRKLIYQVKSNLTTINLFSHLHKQSSFLRLVSL